MRSGVEDTTFDPGVSALLAPARGTFVESAKPYGNVWRTSTYSAAASDPSLTFVVYTQYLDLLNQRSWIQELLLHLTTQSTRAQALHTI